LQEISQEAWKFPFRGMSDSAQLYDTTAGCFRIVVAFPT